MRKAGYFARRGRKWPSASRKPGASRRAGWESSSPRDTEGRERLWAMLRAMDDLEATIAGYVGDGAIALERIQAEEREKALNGG